MFAGTCPPDPFPAAQGQGAQAGQRGLTDPRGRGGVSPPALTSGSVAAADEAAPRVDLSGVREEVAGLGSPRHGCAAPLPVSRSLLGASQSTQKLFPRAVRTACMAWASLWLPSRACNKAPGNPGHHGPAAPTRVLSAAPQEPVREPPAPCCRGHPVGSAAGGCPVWGLGEQGRGNRES